MKKNITIRKCKKDDFLWVLNLLQQLWPKRKFVNKDIKNIFNEALKSNNQHYFCAINNRRIIWFGSFNIKNWLYAMWKVAILDELIVDDACRQMGVARQLVDFMVNFAKKNKCVCIELECSSKRKPAHKFYENYWFDKWTWCFFSIDLM